MKNSIKNIIYRLDCTDAKADKSLWFLQFFNEEAHILAIHS